jgi:hypothetical protein
LCWENFGDHAAMHGTRDDQQAVRAVSSADPRRWTQHQADRYMVPPNPFILMLVEKSWVNMVSSMFQLIKQCLIVNNDYYQTS